QQRAQTSLAVPGNFLDRSHGSDDRFGRSQGDTILLATGRCRSADQLRLVPLLNLQDVLFHPSGVPLGVLQCGAQLGYLALKVGNPRLDAVADSGVSGHGATPGRRWSRLRSPGPGSGGLTLDIVARLPLIGVCYSLRF